AWLKGLFSACNGNASLRFQAPFCHLALITAKGTAKGQLTTHDFSIMDLSNGNCLLGSTLSSEKEMHLAIYSVTNANAILHTHPPKLLACQLKGLLNDLEKLPLYEVRLLKTTLLHVPSLSPGSTTLATAVKKAIQDNPIHDDCGSIWLENHGLCSFGTSLLHTLTISEELEHLAEITLLKMS
ncbi:MAG: class II aldolase/adducin family protein, partial [Desulfovibrio sp.]|nr:class II aldolase/adducin family protein [Desulfovibrio sp.]